MAETFYFEIIASDKKFYSGACEHVIFPAVDGLYGVLANHEDTVTAVVAGELRFKVDGEWKVCVVGEGFAAVSYTHLDVYKRQCHCHLVVTSTFSMDCCRHMYLYC